MKVGFCHWPMEDQVWVEMLNLISDPLQDGAEEAGGSLISRAASAK